MDFVGIGKNLVNHFPTFVPASCILISEYISPISLWQRVKDFPKKLKFCFEVTGENMLRALTASASC